jgi:DNA polymerase-3 subunit gamma/tau
MALLRVLHAADLPDPGKLAKKLDDMAASGVAPAAGDAAAPSGTAPAAAGAIDWQALVEQVDAAGALRVAQTMRDWVRPVEVAQGRLVYALAPGFVGDPAADFRDTLYKLTGSRWDVEQRETGGEPSLREREEAAKAEAQAKMRAHPLVEAAFAAFPEAELVEDAEIQPAGRQAWGR